MTELDQSLQYTASWNKRDLLQIRVLLSLLAKKQDLSILDNASAFGRLHSVFNISRKLNFHFPSFKANSSGQCRIIIVFLWDFTKLNMDMWSVHHCKSELSETQINLCTQSRYDTEQKYKCITRIPWNLAVHFQWVYLDFCLVVAQSRIQTFQPMYKIPDSAWAKNPSRE